MNYKSPDNLIHYLSDNDILNGGELLLPYGCIKITEKEASFITESNKPAPDLKAEALAYLSSTDWYVVRFAETQTPIPAEVLAKRAESRLIV